MPHLMQGKHSEKFSMVTFYSEYIRAPTSSEIFDASSDVQAIEPSQGVDIFVCVYVYVCMYVCI